MFIRYFLFKFGLQLVAWGLVILTMLMLAIIAMSVLIFVVILLAVLMPSISIHFYNVLFTIAACFISFKVAYVIGWRCTSKLKMVLLSIEKHKQNVLIA